MPNAPGLSLIPLVAAALAMMSAAVEAEDRLTLPEVVIHGSPPADPGHERCADVATGNDRSLGCLNQTLKRKVDEVNPVLNIPPIDAKSSDLKVGTVNVPAVQQQYGQNFGHSVIPFRPPPPIFASPLGRR